MKVFGLLLKLGLKSSMFTLVEITSIRVLFLFTYGNLSNSSTPAWVSETMQSALCRYERSSRFVILYIKEPLSQIPASTFSSAQNPRISKINLVLKIFLRQSANKAGT